MNVNKLNRYLIGISLFVGYTLFALSWKAGDLFISNVGYDANDLSSFIAVLNIVKVAVNFLIGVVTAKFIAEKTFLNNSQLFMLGCLSVGASMFALPMGESFYYIAACRALLGFGGAMILFTMNPLVADIFPENELPIINGLNSSAFNVGIAIMLTLSGVMASEPSMVTSAVAAIALMAACLFYMANKSSVSLMKSRLKSANEVQVESKPSEEAYGILDGLKSGFNWLFALTFTGIMSFYYVAFTFLDGETVKYLMYAGIVGNFAGIVGAKALPHIVVARLASFTSVVLAVTFMFTIGSSLSPWIAGALGFVMMFSLPSYVTLGFSQPNSTPKKVGITFMMFWVLSDLLATFILKAYAALASSPATESTATLFILAIAACYPLGCLLIKGEQKTLASAIEVEA